MKVQIIKTHFILLAVPLVWLLAGCAGGGPAIPTDPEKAAAFNEAQQYIAVGKGAKKVLKNPEAQFMPYLALKFRTGTAYTGREDRKVLQKDRAEATAYAMLEGVDAALFQEITDEFYRRFTEKMAGAGFPYASLDEIKATKSFEKYANEEEERHYDHVTYGTSDVYTPAGATFFKYPMLTTKINKWQKELDAALSTLRLTVNFVDFDIDVDVSEKYGLNKVVTTTTANSKAYALIKVECVFQEATWDAATTGSYYNAAGLKLSNKSLRAVDIRNNPIYEPYQAEIIPYDDQLPEFANRKFNVFGGGDLKLGTYVVEADPEDFKRAALKALDRYIDYVVTIVSAYRE